MRPTLKLGATGPDVVHLQTLLKALPVGQALTADGDFGRKTEVAVEAFQEGKGLYADGIVGKATWAALENGQGEIPTSPTMPTNPVARQAVQTINFPEGSYPTGSYDKVRLRADAAKVATGLIESLLALGVKPSSSGGMRDLGAPVGPSRSAVSLHYIGRAWDLFVGGGMANPTKDAYIITRDAGRCWRVWARCAATYGEQRTLQAVRAGQPEVEVTARVIDLTELFKSQGFARIASRPNSWEGIAKNASLHSGTEWWHFQYEGGLVKGKTTFGSELLQVHSPADLVSSPPWQYRDRIWSTGTFV